MEGAGESLCCCCVYVWFDRDDSRNQESRVGGDAGDEASLTSLSAAPLGKPAGTRALARVLFKTDASPSSRAQSHAHTPTRRTSV